MVGCRAGSGHSGWGCGQQQSVLTCDARRSRMSDMHTSAQLGHVRTRALENQTEESAAAFFLLPGSDCSRDADHAADPLTPRRPRR